MRSIPDKEWKDVQVVSALVTVHFFAAVSLKDKRMLLRSLLDRTRARFNVALAEVGAQDEHRRAELGLAAVSASVTQARQLAEAVVRFLEAETERSGEAEVVAVEWQ